MSAEVASAPATPKAAPKAKASKPKVAKKAASHPSYNDMIKKAITALKERNGSSRQAIQKYIMANYNVGKEEKSISAHMRMGLKRGVVSGALKQVKGTGASGSFRVAEKGGDKKPKVAKKPAAKKPAAKKPAGEKKAAKPKKPKAAKKPAAAKKPKTPKKAKAPKKVSVKKPKSPKAKKPAAKKAAKSPKAKKPAAKKAAAKK